MLDRAIAATAVVLAAAYFYGTAQIPMSEFGDPIGPRLFPYLCGGVFVIGAIILALETVLKPKPAEVAADPETIGNGKHPGAMILVVLIWSIAYVASFEAAGYVLASVVFLLGLTIYFHPGKWITNILVSVLVPLVTYIVFHRWLNVSLPAGWLGF